MDSFALNIDYTTCQRSEGSKCAEDTLEGLRKYLTHPELVIMYNSQRFDEGNYGQPNKPTNPLYPDVFEAPIINESVIWN